MEKWIRIFDDQWQWTIKLEREICSWQFDIIHTNVWKFIKWHDKSVEWGIHTGSKKRKDIYKMARKHEKYKLH